MVEEDLEVDPPASVAQVQGLQGLQGSATTPDLCSAGLNLGSHACQAGTIPTEAYSQLFGLIFAWLL